MTEYLQLDLDATPPHEAAAILLATLAYPGSQQLKMRQDTAVSLSAWFIRERASRDQAWSLDRALIKPLHLARAESEIRRDLRPLEQILRYRLTAGDMALVYLKEVLLGRAFSLPRSARRLSLNELSKFAANDLDWSEAANVPTRVWRPSRSVLHYAAAWAAVIAEKVSDGGSYAWITELAERPQLIARILVEGHAYEALLARSRLAIAPETLIRFRPPRFIKNLAV